MRLQMGKFYHTPPYNSDLDAKMPRGIDVWSISGKFFMCIPFELLIL